MHLSIRTRILCFGLSLAFSVSVLHGQTETISGVINRYTPVLRIDTCNSAVMVRSSAGFGAGDKVLLVQMQGATISLTDSSIFGTILSYNNAGNFELGTVAWVDGSAIFLRNRLLRQYTISGRVQLVRVPQYTNVIIHGAVLALPWNGETGGVLALVASDTVVLEGTGAVLAASWMGFRGGVASLAAPYNDISYDSRQGYRYSKASGLGGQKGEGIVAYPVSFESGRGKLANGGGGGNSRSSGGGGGGNYGVGGQGGYQYRGIAQSDIGGRGGGVLLYDTANPKIFMGGGGGGGHQDTGWATYGFPGGGIVMVQADVFIGNGGAIEAQARGYQSPLDASPSAIRAGGGGGGAGGTVLLDINFFPTTDIFGFVLHAYGSKGWDVTVAPDSSTADTNQCYGPGGGGGGGVIWVKDTAALHMDLTSREFLIKADTAGIVKNSNSPFNNTPYGATDGTSGAVLSGFRIPESTIPR